MSEADWSDASRLSVGMLLDGTRIGELDHEGQPIVGDSLYVFLNASAQAVTITLPQVPSGAAWEHVLDTNEPAGACRDVCPRHGAGGRAARRAHLSRVIPPCPPGPGV
jgi:hypothetical protein